MVAAELTPSMRADAATVQAIFLLREMGEEERSFFIGFRVFRLRLLAGR